jgi:hypothetical protein
VKQELQPYPFISETDTSTEIIPVSIMPEPPAISGTLQEPYIYDKSAIHIKKEHIDSETKKNTKTADTAQKTDAPLIVEDKNIELGSEIALFDSVTTFESPKQTTTSTTHKKEAKEEVIQIRYDSIGTASNSWMFWLILSTFILFSWTRIFYKKKLQFLFRALFNYNFALKSIQQHNEFSNRFSSILSIIFAVNMGLFCLQISNAGFYEYQSGINAIVITLAIAAAITVLYWLKKILFIILGFIFQARQYAEEYIENVYLFNHALGLFLFPVILSIGFVDPEIISNQTLIYIGLSVISIFYFFRFIRGIQISIRTNVSIFYMFLYFCTLELLPIILLAKIGILMSKTFL